MADKKLLGTFGDTTDNAFVALSGTQVIAGDKTFSNIVQANGGLAYNVYTLAGGTYNNLSLHGDSCVILANTATSNVTITGIAGGVAGKIIYIIKTGAPNSLILSYASSSSSLANRMFFNSQADKTYTGYACIALVYSGGLWYSINQ